MIGAIDGLTFDSATAELPAGSRLYLYSDGIHELARDDGSMWSLDEFLEGAGREARGPDGAVERLVAASRAWQSRQEFQDDVSVLEAVFP
jgi:sigma-B regulation protein RsbU (phosphoserine phosphatase)